jgi:hypothetical protein
MELEEYEEAIDLNFLFLFVRHNDRSLLTRLLPLHRYSFINPAAWHGVRLGRLDNTPVTYLDKSDWQGIGQSR